MDVPAEKRNKHQPSRKTEGANSTRKPGVAWSTLLPLLAFLLVVCGALGLYSWQGLQARAKIAERQAANEILGLPRDYPLDVVPLYRDAKILKADRGDTTSTEGQPMDRWYIHATVKDQPKAVFDYYNDMLLKRGMRQTTFYSIPTGFGIDLADEQYAVSFIMETRQETPDTSLEITVNRLRD